MFDRFSGSARSVTFRARDIAHSEGRKFVEPSQILLALMECCPGLFQGTSEQPIDLQSARHELMQAVAAPNGFPDSTKLRFSEQSKRVMRAATREARSCWEKWEAPRRKQGQMLPEDLSHREARLRQPLKATRLPSWLMRWALRREWEVDERHLLLGLLTVTGCPGSAVLAKYGLTLEAVRQRLCARER